MRTKDNQEQTITMPFEGEVITNDGEAKGKNHPNFIESNTQEISLEELTERNIIPTFSDNSLTISHQNFISAVTKVANNVFGELTPVELRASHPIIGRIPSAQHKKAYELTEKRRPYSTKGWLSAVTYLTLQGQSTARQFIFVLEE